MIDDVRFMIDDLLTTLGQSSEPITPAFGVAKCQLPR